jgi:hypothetical protein
MFVLDTNVLSELRPGKPGQSQAVRAWASTIAESQFFLSAVTLLECEKGILQLERKTPPQGAALRAWWDGVREAFDGRILPFAAEAALRCAAMHVPDPKSWRDSMIAAIALVHGFTLVTRNTGDFAGTGTKILNPWELV